jgi:hypothetical protein
MRRWAVAVLLAGFAMPVFAGRPAVTHDVTVDQLAQVLAHVRYRWDGRLAKQISDMRLTQRLSAARLVRLEEQLPGSQSRQALLALADESAFLDLPTDEIPSDPAPSAAAQTALLNEASGFVGDTIDRLPSFTATRETTRYEGTATVISGRLQTEFFTLNLWRAPSAVNWECPGEPKIGYRRLSIIDRTHVAIVYRHGHEVHALDEKGGEFECPENSVSTTEEFGHVIAWIPRVVEQGKLVWSHWEREATGLVAVFQYSTMLPLKTSAPMAVRGEITLDPANGTILRLTEVRRWNEQEPGYNGKPGYEAPVERDAEVDFGPVNIGGNVFYCPVRRVAIYRAPILWPRGSAPEIDEIYRQNGLTEPPLLEYLNDVTFTGYRLYTSR